MTATREAAVAAVKAVRQELDRIVASAGGEAWSNEAYEGWTARELLSHIAATSNVAGFLLAMSANPGATFSGEMDNDTFNARQVAMRESKPIGEVVEEARGHLAEDVERVAAASDELLERQYAAPWGDEGPISDLIVGAANDHLMIHLRDLAAALE